MLPRIPDGGGLNRKQSFFYETRRHVGAQRNIALTIVFVCFILFLGRDKQSLVPHDGASEAQLELLQTQLELLTANRVPRTSDKHREPKPRAQKIQPLSPEALEQQYKTPSMSTAVVISSTWHPSHPSTEIIDTVIESIHKYLRGIKPDTPIFITVDRLPWYAENQRSRNKDLDQYVKNLKAKYPPNRTPVQVMEYTSYYEVLDMLKFVYPFVKYVYRTPHNVAFRQPVDHSGLLGLLLGQGGRSKDAKCLLFPNGQNHQDFQKRVSCSGKDKLPTRKSRFTKQVDEMLHKDSAIDGTAYVCKSCQYSEYTTQFVALDWYLQTASKLSPGGGRFKESKMQEKLDAFCEDQYNDNDNDDDKQFEFGTYAFYDDKLSSHAVGFLDEFDPETEAAVASANNSSAFHSNPAFGS